MFKNRLNHAKNLQRTNAAWMVPPFLNRMLAAAPFIVQVHKEVKKTVLYITVTHKSVDEMASLLNFDAEQRRQLKELMEANQRTFSVRP